MTNEKRPDSLAFLPARYRDWLDELAARDMRDALSELYWIIECTRNGRFLDQGDNFKFRSVDGQPARYVRRISGGSSDSGNVPEGS